MYLCTIMLPLSLAILAVLFPYIIDGNQRIVRVSELISDDEDFVTSGEDDNSHICCVLQYGNCPCKKNSLDHALANLTSNVLINITTDVILSSLITASGLGNVSLIGHNNPTVNCKSVGGINFIFCHNCVIQGITWDGCGTKNIDNYIMPGLKLSYSSNITIQNCSFQHSVGQAVVLSEVLGDVNINGCKFVNSHYRGHGAAIHYSSNNTRNSSQFVITISNCNFSYNKMEGLVYLKNGLFNNNKMVFINSIFCNNKGTPVYAINHKVYLNGNILFQNNVAENGAGIYISDYSTVIFAKNSVASFIQNSANDRGGMMFLRNHSICLFDENSKVTFSDNKATNGNIFAEDSSNVTFKAEVTFSSNSATRHGAAIYSVYNSHITFTGNAKVTFNNNFIKHKNVGGIIYSDGNCFISFEDNSITVFSGNIAYLGGAIYSNDNSHIFFKGNTITVFNNNTADYGGGAIFSNDNNYMSFEGNSTTKFINNTAKFGGAILSYDTSFVSFEENSTIMLISNTADPNGGAIFSYDNSHMTFEGNSTTTFINNTASSGGAIQSYDKSHISFEGHSTTVFYSNIAEYGGAIESYDNSYISFEANSTTVFGNNTADNNGGAIHSYDDSHISFEGNATTIFNNNAVGLGGGALFSHDNSYISFEQNSIALFSNNTAGSGGAIYCKDNYVSFTGNSTTTFSNNNAQLGGVIFCYDSSYIFFERNSNTFFSNNTAYYNGGTIYSIDSCYIFFRENSITVFSDNTAANYGGAISARYSDITFDDNSTVTFNDNNATFGATVFSISNSNIIAKGHSSVEFNDFSPKWCNNICLPYSSQDDVVTIDSGGMVWCSYQKAFVCLTIKCYCKSLEDILQPGVIKYSISVNISDDVVVLSSPINLYVDDALIIGHNNPTVICVNGGRMEVRSLNNGDLLIEGITWIGCGAVTYDVATEGIGALTIIDYSNVTIQNCSFKYSMGQILSLSDVRGNISINNCNFANNYHYSDIGTAIYYSPFGGEMFDVFTIKNCRFDFNKGAKSVVFLDLEESSDTHSHVYLIDSVFCNNEGPSIHLSGYNYCILYINGEILFENNVAENGAGIRIDDHSTVIFSENSNTKFVNNTANHNGAAVFLNDHSSVIFDNNSIVTFNDNKATNGTIYSRASSDITFKATCQVTFSSNSATQYGSAIYSSDNSHVTFTGNATVIFNNNVLPFSNIYVQIGGTIFSENVGYLSFKDNSVTIFHDNVASFGTAILSVYNSTVIFKDRSRVSFNNNTVHYCGILTSALFSNVTFTDNSIVTYDTNTVSHTLSTNYESSAGAICTFQNCKITFSEHSLVTLINNRADRGGALIISESNVFIEGYSIVTFNNNFAWYSSGGAFVCSNNSNITIKDNSNVTFNDNKASQSGGAIHSYNMCNITFKDNSILSFINNAVRNNGGAILSSQNSEINFDGNSTVTFNDNMADNGGALYIDNGSVVTFSEFTNVEFNHNSAFYGGAVLANDHCTITLTGNSDLLFAHNEALQSGGAGYFNYNCNFIIQENALVAHLTITELCMVELYAL